MIKERELIAELKLAENNGDGLALEQATSKLALFYVAKKEFTAAVPYWRKGSDLLAAYAPGSIELANYFYNMAELCLLPAGLHYEAQTTIVKAKVLYKRHLKLNDPVLKNIEKLLGEIKRRTKSS